MSGRPIDHVALAVADLGASEKLYESLGFVVRYRERVADQGVDIVGMAAGDATIELLKPLADDSPVARYLGNRRSRLHHLAYRVDDIRAELDRLSALGMRLIDRTPRRGALGTLVAFIHPSSTGGVLVEVCQRRAR